MKDIVDEFKTEKIALCRIIKGIIQDELLTQTEAAKLLNISQPKISHICNEKTDIFTMQSLFKIINTLGFDVEITISQSKEALGRIEIFK